MEHNMQAAAELIRTAENMLCGTAPPWVGTPYEVARTLIEIVDAPYSWGISERDAAAGLLVGFCDRYEAVRDLVLIAAEEYVSNQIIDDAYPWSPNAIEVLSQVRNTAPETVLFLERFGHKVKGKVEWLIPSANRDESRTNAAVPALGELARQSDFQTLEDVGRARLDLSEALHLAVPIAEGVALVASIVLALHATLATLTAMASTLRCTLV